MITLVASTLLLLPAQLHAQLEKQLLPLIQDHQGDVSVIIKNLKTGESFLHNAEQVMPTASLIKFPMLIELYQQVATGKASLEKMVTLQQTDKVPGSGILTDHFDVGTELSIQTVARLMMRYSDNTATNIIADHIGIASTSEAMNRLGLPETQLHSKVYRRDTSVAPERSIKYGLGSTTANDMLTLLEKLHSKELVSKEASEAMLAHMASCADDSQLKRHLPKSVKAYHKTGAVNDVRTDAGLFETPGGTILMVVLTANNEDMSWTDSNAAEVLSGRIGQIAYEWFNPPSASPNPTEKIEGELRIGATGNLVKALQRTLNERAEPSPELGVDGDFGAMTAAAVKQFQTAHKLPATGNVGPATWEKLAPVLFDEQSVRPLRALPPKTPADELSGKPFVTARGWVVYDIGSGEVIDGDQHNIPLHFASTTKMMTAWLVCKLAASQPEILDEMVVYSKRADETVGSTSDVREGESLTVRDTLYGLMLPSGNDASVALAEHFGERIKPDNWDESRDALAMFVAAMNSEAKSLGMANSSFANPHGLTHENHKSSCVDLAVLAKMLLNDPIAQEVISTREYSCTLTGSSGYKRDATWRNTNNLLGIEGYIGVKTGTTDAAGACLVSCSQRDGRRLVVVVLGAASSPARYADSRNLHRWGWQSVADAK